MCKKIEYTTPKGGVLTIIGNTLESRRKVILRCSICSEDQGLFPDGSITSLKSNLNRGQIPCNCSKGNTYWKEWQQEIRVRRLCTQMGLEFLGFSEPFTGARTKLRLLNVERGFCWNSTELDAFIRNHTTMGKGKMKKTDEYMVNRFLGTGKFLEGTLFTRADKCSSGYMWDMYCPLCSNDEYVKNKVCEGVFTIPCSSASKGSIPCRCSPNYRWTKDQRDYQLSVRLKELKGDFIKWKGEYIGSHSMFEWRCKEGHVTNGKIYDFICNNRGCSLCQISNGRGLFPPRAEEQDNLYILNIGNKYIKVGRSFNIERRVKDIAKAVEESIIVLSLYKGSHIDVYGAEQRILEDFKRYKPQENWSSELFIVEVYSRIKEALSKEKQIEEVVV